MRAEDDLTYQEYKEGVEDAMRYIKNHGMILLKHYKRII